MYLVRKQAFGLKLKIHKVARLTPATVFLDTGEGFRRRSERNVAIFNKYEEAQDVIAAAERAYDEKIVEAKKAVDAANARFGTLLTNKLAMISNQGDIDP